MCDKDRGIGHIYSVNFPRVVGHHKLQLPSILSCDVYLWHPGGPQGCLHPKGHCVKQVTTTLQDLEAKIIRKDDKKFKRLMKQHNKQSKRMDTMFQDCSVVDNGKVADIKIMSIELPDCRFDLYDKEDICLLKSCSSVLFEELTKW